MAKTKLEDMPKQIKLEDHVYEALGDLGHKNDTYSEVVERLIDFYKKHQHQPVKGKKEV